MDQLNRLKRSVIWHTRVIESLLATCCSVSFCTELNAGFNSAGSWKCQYFKIDVALLLGLSAVQGCLHTRLWEDLHCRRLWQTMVDYVQMCKINFRF